MQKMLNVQRGKVCLGQQPVILKGVNFGGWLMMEGYIMHARNIAVQVFKKGFQKHLGEGALEDFERSFNSTFIQDSDFKNVAAMGFNCIRLPFHYRLIEKAPHQFDQNGLKLLDKAVNLAKQNGLWVILDLHAVVGAQNHDWHSDSLGPAGFWKKKSYEDRMVELWGFLADHFKNEPAVAGYDVLNEAVLADTKLLNHFYHRVIKRIRAVDLRHMIFIEGSRWAQDLECLDQFDDDNIVLSIHFYEAADFVFNLVPQQKYPQNRPGIYSRSRIKEVMDKHLKVAKRHKTPVYVGEFGVNSRGGLYGEDRWLRDVLAIFKSYGFHWTYWTYKAIKNAQHPDGLYSYYENPPWVNRGGVLTGWENYHLHWSLLKDKIVASWKTEHFRRNECVWNELKRALAKR